MQLLESGLKALKTGGQIVYATCSLAPEEDEAVLDGILRAYPGSVRIEAVSDKLSLSAPGLSQFGDMAYHPDMTHALRLWPHRTGMSGFFCALLRKTGIIPYQKDAPPSREFSKTGLAPLKAEEKHQIITTIHQDYGLDLEKILAAYEIALHRRYDQVFLIPEKYLEGFSTLPYDYIGMPLAQRVAEGLVPSHEFISRFGGQFTRGIIRITDADIPQWVSGRDIRYPPTNLTPRGQYLLVKDKDGRNLGLGKLLPKRLRNMLPRSSR